mgnify:CR=1 FL=1
MGTGKLPTPGTRSKLRKENRVRGCANSIEQQEAAAQGKTDDSGLTIAELVCELLYAGKTRAEIAGYDDAFMSWVLCRERDDYGKLLRRSSDLPWWVTTDSRGQWVINNPKPFSAMFHDVMRHRGLDDRQRQDAWAQWRQENPGFGRGGQ